MGDGVVDMTGRRWGSWWAGVLLVLLCLAVYLPGVMSIPVVDRDEARFAQASRQMLESGDYVVPRVQGKPRLNKPPLIYWLQAASARVLTRGDVRADAIWMYRMPSLLAGLLAVLATWRMGNSMFGGRAGWIGAAILGVCPVMYWESHQARADMVLVACTTVAVWMVWEVWRETEGRRDEEAGAGSLRLFILWLAVGAGVMTKGPLTLMVVGLGVLAICIMTGRWRWTLRLHPILGLIVVAAMLAPWVWLVTRQVGWDVYVSTIRDEVLGRSLEPKEGHGGPPGYHTLLMPALLFPGSVLVGAGIWTAIKDVRAGWAARRNGQLDETAAADNPHVLSRRASVFLLAMIVPSWLVFEVVGTKLPHYTMPLYPMLAILTAQVVCAGAAEFSALLQARMVRGALAVWLFAVPIVVLGAGLILGASFLRVSSLVLAGGAAVIIAGVFAIAAARAFRRRDMARLQILAILSWIPVTAAVSVALPRIRPMWVSREVVREFAKLDPAGTRPIAAVEFHEDSLVFLTRGRVDRIKDDEIDAWFAAHPTGLAVVPGMMNLNASRWPVLGGVEGFNYTKGKLVTLAIVGTRR
jgi:4-amino-4-deoxy-L-arabinose transferase-like glycosyltransferase